MTQNPERQLYCTVYFRKANIPFEEDMLVERNADNSVYEMGLDAENPMNVTIPFTELTDQHYNVYIISDDFLQKESNLNSTQPSNSHILQMLS